MYIDIIYATATQQDIVTVNIDQGSTIKDAIIASNILSRHTELKLDSLRVGIYSEQKMLDTILSKDDRIEIYRDLLIDPKEARIIRAEHKRKKQGLKPFGA